MHQKLCGGRALPGAGRASAPRDLGSGRGGMERKGEGGRERKRGDREGDQEGRDGGDDWDEGKVAAIQ